MRIVLLFFCAILVFLSLILILVVTSSLKLNAEKIYVSNVKSGIKLHKPQKEFLVYFEIYLFGKIKIAKIQINKELLEKLKAKNKIENIEKDIKIIKKVKALDIIKKLKISIDKFKLNAEIGTEDVCLTAAVVTFISSVIRYNVRKF